MRILCTIMVSLSVLSADLFVFSRDGKTATTSPRELPSVGQPIGNPTAVVFLLSASDADRASCGWYPCVRSSKTAPAGFRVSGRAWAIEEAQAIEQLSFTPIPMKNYELSKFKIVQGLHAVGALEGFMSYLNADVTRKFMWDAATTLDSTNTLVVAAVEELSQSLGLPAVSNILYSARIRK